MLLGSLVSEPVLPTERGGGAARRWDRCRGAPWALSEHATAASSMMPSGMLRVIALCGGPVVAAEFCGASGVSPAQLRLYKPHSLRGG